MMRAWLSIYSLFTIALCSTQPGDNNDNPNLMFQSKQKADCTPKCDAEQILWFKKDLPTFESNGCGSGFFATRSFHYVECCDIHDACMEICGANVFLCDHQFARCIRDKCKTKPFEHFCTFRGEVMQEAITQFFTCDVYKEAQEQACTCYDEQELDKKLKANIRAIYKKIKKPQLSDAEITSKIQYLKQPSKHKVTLDNSWKGIDWIMDIVAKHHNVMIHYNGKDWKWSIHNKLKSGWEKVSNVVKKGWNKVKQGGKKVGNWFKKGWNKFKGLFSANVELYDEHEMESGEQDNADNMNVFVIDAMEDVEDISLFFLSIILMLMILGCTCMGAICGFIVALNTK